jgi:hypothetical protein
MNQVLSPLRYGTQLLQHICSCVYKRIQSLHCFPLHILLIATLTAQEEQLHMVIITYAIEISVKSGN